MFVIHRSYPAVVTAAARCAARRRRTAAAWCAAARCPARRTAARSSATPDTVLPVRASVSKNLHANAVPKSSYHLSAVGLDLPPAAPPASASVPASIHPTTRATPATVRPVSCSLPSAATVTMRNAKQFLVLKKSSRAGCRAVSHCLAANTPASRLVIKDLVILASALNLAWRSVPAAVTLAQHRATWRPAHPAPARRRAAAPCGPPAPVTAGTRSELARIMHGI